MEQGMHCNLPHHERLFLAAPVIPGYNKRRSLILALLCHYKMSDHRLAAYAVFLGDDMQHILRTTLKHYCTPDK